MISFFSLCYQLTGKDTEHCISHDLVIVKLAARGLLLSDLKLILSNLSDCQQYVKMNPIQINFMKIISSVPQSPILGPIYFNLSIKDLFFFTEIFFPSMILPTIIRYQLGKRFLNW